MSKNFKKSVCMLMVGVAISTSNVGVAKASEVTNYKDTLVSRLDNLQSASKGVINKTDYTHLFKNEYLVNLESKVMSATEMGLVKKDISKMSNADMKTVIENELFFLKSAYDYIVDFGCEYEYDSFYTYNNSEISLVAFDFYVYSLIQQYIEKGGAGANELAKMYTDLSGIKECILNFSYITANFRESKIVELDNITWSKDSKFDKFRQ